MYATINQNIEVLLDSFDVEKDINDYLWLLKELPKRNVAKDQKFQKKYREHWAMRFLASKSKYLAEYFNYLENLKNENKPVTVKKVACHLHSFPTSKNGGKTLQFSFASKLVHMLDTEQPIYDSQVKKFFFLPDPPQNFDKKLSVLQTSYDFLCNEYERVVEQKLLAESIEQFRKRFDLEKNTNYIDRKIIDTLIWKFVGCLEKGAVRDGRVVYS